MDFDTGTSLAADLVDDLPAAPNDAADVGAWHQ